MEGAEGQERRIARGREEDDVKGARMHACTHARARAYTHTSPRQACRTAPFGHTLFHERRAPSSTHRGGSDLSVLLFPFSCIFTWARTHARTHMATGPGADA
jgi:hypothetical protein